MDRIYLDWNATAPIRAEVLARMVDALATTGNPSSVHAQGRARRPRASRMRLKPA
jgi:cysteine desulfurase